MNKEIYAYKNGAHRAADSNRPRPDPMRRSPLPSYVWLDGELVPYERATVHLLNPTMHYGAGVFEGIRCYATRRGAAAFRLREHLQRFVDSSRVLGLDERRYSVDWLRDVVCRVVRANNLAECYVRPLLYFEGSLGFNLDNYRPVLSIAAWQWDDRSSQQAQQAGVRVMLSTASGSWANAETGRARISGQHVQPIVARTMAQREGFDEVVLLDADGHVAESSAEDLLLVRDGFLYTSARSTTLGGITRDSVLTLAWDADYQVVERPLSRELLYSADEAMLCSTAAEIVPVREIDQRPVNGGRVGPITRELQQLFWRTVRGQGRRSAEWLDYMVLEPLY